MNPRTPRPCNCGTEKYCKKHQMPGVPQVSTASPLPNAATQCSNCESLQARARVAEQAREKLAKRWRDQLDKTVYEKERADIAEQALTLALEEQGRLSLWHRGDPEAFKRCIEEAKAKWLATATADQISSDSKTPSK